MKKLATAENFNFSKGVENFTPGGIFGNLFTPPHIFIPPLISGPPPPPISGVAATANKATDAIVRSGTGYVGGEHYNAGQQFLVAPTTQVINNIPGTQNGQAWRQLVWNNKQSGHFVRDADVSLVVAPTYLQPTPTGGGTTAAPIGNQTQNIAPQSWLQRLFNPTVQPTPQPTQPTYQHPVYQNGVWVYGYDQYGNPLDQYGNPIYQQGYNPNYNPNAPDYGQSTQDQTASDSEAQYQAELDNQ